jgi:NAD(P)-dependent dehydrogenase (short-subunit alcohol dehydrogenase family)
VGKEAQSSRGRLGLSISRTHPAPLRGKGAAAIPSFSRALTTRARSFAFGGGAYSASKAWLAIFLEGLRVDLQGTGVDVTSIHPGFVKSEMTQKNEHPMPFLLETEDAVERTARAIVRADAEYAFPWQLWSVMRMAKVMPNGLWNATSRKLG